MEVHAHTHLASGETHTARKKFTHYLWESLMLFLAVFCGFQAEKFREHQIELNREKQFIVSFCRDLELDTIRLNRLISFRNRILTKIDSLRYYLNMPDLDKYGKFIYYYARPITSRAIFYSNDRTIEQLKNAGNLRLIRNQAASDSIMDYDWEVRRNEHIKEREEAFGMDYIEIMKQLFDGEEFDKMINNNNPITEWNWPVGNPHLLHKDKESIQRLKNSLHFMKSINVFDQVWSRDRIKSALKILEFLKKEYHLK